MQEQEINLHEYFVKMIEEYPIRDTLINPKDTVTLFHGTTTAYLRDILIHGLLPREQTKNSNFTGLAESAKNAVYLTNKWHYIYAYRTTETYFEKKYGENWAETDNVWWRTAESLPCYIEIEVPKELLAVDEDIIYQKFFRQLLKSSLKKHPDKRGDIQLTYKESLAHAGTVAVIGGVKPEWIRSFTVLGNPELYLKLEKSKYRKEHDRWVRGQGCGSKDLMPFLKLEAESDLNGTFWTKDIPPGAVLNGFDVNPNNGKIRIHYKKPSINQEK